MEISEAPSPTVHHLSGNSVQRQDYDIQIFSQYHLARAPDLQSRRIQEQLNLLIGQPGTTQFVNLIVCDLHIQLHFFFLIYLFVKKIKKKTQDLLFFIIRI